MLFNKKSQRKNQTVTFKTKKKETEKARSAVFIQTTATTWLCPVLKNYF